MSNSLRRRSPGKPTLGQRFRMKLYIEQLESRTLLAVLTPAQIRHAYGFDKFDFQANGQTLAASGAGQTIAIVAAFDDPNILNDLKKFDTQFNLPDPVFEKAMPQGQPAGDRGWATEIALDVEWAHSIAPLAKILLVESRSSSISSLLGAVDYARKQPGVSVVSMSWCSGEFSTESRYDSYFTTPANHGGVTFVAASGDSGAWYGAEWPSVSPNVVGVGGTYLRTQDSAGTYYSEKGWAGSGGGYSHYVNEPGFQLGVQKSGARTTPDVAYNADPNSGVYVYDSYGAGGWVSVGGTSAGAPQWAGLIAVANQGRALAGKTSLDGPGQTLYALYQMASKSATTNYHDIVSGSNGYSAHTGYDLVTGLGTPIVGKTMEALINATGTYASVNIVLPAGGGGVLKPHSLTVAVLPPGGQNIGSPRPESETKFFVSAEGGNVAIPAVASRSNPNAMGQSHQTSELLADAIPTRTTVPGVVSTGPGISDAKVNDENDLPALDEFSIRDKVSGGKPASLSFSVLDETLALHAASMMSLHQIKTATDACFVQNEHDSVLPNAVTAAISDASMNPAAAMAGVLLAMGGFWGRTLRPNEKKQSRLTTKVR